MAIGYIAGTLLAPLREPWRDWRYRRLCRRLDRLFPNPRRSFNHENRRGANEIALEEWEAMRTPPPVRLDEGRVQRGNGGNNPATPKPDIIPKPQFPSPREIPGDTP